MELYDKQKNFNIKKFKKLIYDSSFYSDGNFVFMEQFLKITNYPSKALTLKNWCLFEGGVNEPEPENCTTCYNVIKKFVPADVNDYSLIECSMAHLRLGYKKLFQTFIYETTITNEQGEPEDHEIIKYIDVDYLQYLNIDNCLFRTTADPYGPIIIYAKSSLEPIGLIMPCIIR